MSDPTSETVTLGGPRGSCPAMLFRPATPGPHPAVVVGQEATGPNEFIRHVGRALADAGHVVIVPDYYRGQGPPEPENYEDFETLIGYMDRLDFTQATHDLLVGLHFLRDQSYVDPKRTAVWGYCTGATIALLAACVTRDLAATILFYPSQPRFDLHDDHRPVDALDLLWGLESDVLLMVGDADIVWPSELVTETRRRLEHWGVTHTIKTYAGAGHAFCAPAPSLHHPQAERDGWADALDHLARAIGTRR